MNIKDKEIVITGANRGIGWALAEESARREASLCLIVRQSSSVSDQMIESLQSLGAKKVRVLEQDLGQVNELSRLTDQVFKDHQPVCLINNAGLLTGGLLEKQDPEKIKKLIDVNVTALTLLTQAFLPFFLKAGEGKIVNNASVMGEMCFPASTVYAASKAYVIGLTEALRQETKGTGVSTLIMYTPGVKTDMYDDIFEQYGGHLDLDFLSSIPAAEWARKVIDAIESDADEVRPSGMTGFGLTLSRHFPKAFESLIATKFHR